MASQTRAPGAATNLSEEPYIGAIEWSDAEAVMTDDSSAAMAMSVEGSETCMIHCSSFGFSIPAGSTINGIKAKIRKFQGGIAIAVDFAVVIFSDSTFGYDSENKADTVNKWPEAEDKFTYGGATDLWGQSFSADDINDSGFGVMIMSYPIGDGDGGKTNVYVQYMEMTVYYTESSSDPGLILACI